jgi:two-component system, chemotaxis family, protein-glutamate methylesterase/glutaminase
VTGHDIIVVGASAGGRQALTRLLANLPADLPAAVFIVIHGAPRFLELFARVTRLSVCYPNDNEAIRHGTIYLSPTDHHLLVNKDRVRVIRGPRENAWRPSINALFRSAAVAYGSRVVAVVLSGSLDDGASGMAAVKQRGGVAMIQDPGDAIVPDMPRAAASVATIDHTLPVEEIAVALARLAREPAGDSPPPSRELLLESRIAEGFSGRDSAEQSGALSAMICPECSGPLWQLCGDDKSYRCQVGHAYSLGSLMENGDVQLEQTLWAAVRMFEQRATLTRQIAGRDEERRTGQRSPLASHYEARAREADAHAQALRKLIVVGAASREPDLQES